MAADRSRAVLTRGFGILANISGEWSNTGPATNDTLQHIMSVSVGELPDSDTKALYHVLSTLAGSDSWLDLEYREHMFQIGAVVWALRVGPRGLAIGWEEGQTFVETLYAAEQEYLAAHAGVVGHKVALLKFAQHFRAWGVRVRKMVEAVKEAKEMEGSKG